MRFLISPRPRYSYSVGIFLDRVTRELSRRGYKWTAQPFHYLGLSVLPWDYAFMFGVPRHMNRILGSGKTVITTMGKPQTEEECKGTDGQYLPFHEQQMLMMAEAILKSDKVVFISNYVKNIWKQIFEKRCWPFPSEDKYRIIHHGVDTNLFSPSDEIQISPFVIGTAGTIRNRFRLRTFFAVSKLLDFEHRLLIVGSMTPECLDEFAKATCEASVRNRTVYVSWVNASYLPKLYRQMHCLFHPVDYEGCGIVPIEALSCGVPVVVPAFGAPMEYVLPSGGIAVKTKQFQYDAEFCERMAEAVTSVYNNLPMYSNAARGRAVKCLSIEKTVNQYLDFMQLPRTLARK
jgi:glycosyltransferase involved in cell wall biosynthesis